MSNAEKNEILEAIKNLSNKVDIIQKDVAKIPEIEKQVAKIPEIEKQVAKIPEIEKQVAKIPEIEKQLAKIPEIEKQVGNIKLKIIPEMQSDIRNISRSVAVIEKEHGEKLQILLDAFVGHQERSQINEQRINCCERKLEKHDLQIDFLMEKAEGL